MRIQEALERTSESGTAVSSDSHWFSSFHPFVILSFRILFLATVSTTSIT
jgi:hypothetical protein